MVTTAGRLLVLLGLLGSLACAFRDANLLDSETDWNYDQNGKDWNFADCNNTSITQSPYGLMTAAPYPKNSYVWSSMCDVSFLTAWNPTLITADKHGVSDYVYRINATDGNMGSWYAVEPFAGSAQILWEVEQIRFHYPSEHSIDGVSFDLEMQIVMTDKLNRAVYCSSHRGAFSLFFNVGETQSSFWDWVGKPEF